MSTRRGSARDRRAGTSTRSDLASARWISSRLLDSWEELIEPERVRVRCRAGAGGNVRPESVAEIVGASQISDVTVANGELAAIHTDGLS